MDPRLTDLYDLVHLDPARGRELSEEEMIRARAQLDRIVNDPPAVEASAVGASAVGAPRHSRRRVAVVGVLAGGLAATAVVTATTVSAPTAAYADWTPEPSSITPAQALAQAQQCRDDDVDGARHLGDGSTSSSTSVDASDIALAERRGRSTVVLFQHGDQGASLCTSNGSAGTASQGFDSRDPSEPPVAAGRVRVYFASSDGGAGESDTSTSYTRVAGRVGADVTAVDVLTTTNGRVEATVSNGWFLAWWPTDKDPHAHPDLVVHHKDGTSITAPPERFWK